MGLPELTSHQVRGHRQRPHPLETSPTGAAVPLRAFAPIVPTTTPRSTGCARRRPVQLSTARTRSAWCSRRRVALRRCPSRRRCAASRSVACGPRCSSQSSRADPAQRRSHRRHVGRASCPAPGRRVRPGSAPTRRTQPAVAAARRASHPATRNDGQLPSGRTLPDARNAGGGAERRPEPAVVASWTACVVHPATVSQKAALAVR